MADNTTSTMDENSYVIGINGVKEANGMASRRPLEASRSFGQDMTNRGEVAIIDYSKVKHHLETVVPLHSFSDISTKPDLSQRNVIYNTNVNSPMKCDMNDSDINNISDSMLNVSIIDFDKNDSEDPQNVTVYVKEIIDHLTRTEIKYCVSHDYMRIQSDINYKMRTILVDWLIEVHLKFKLIPETLFLTVNIMDRYLSRVPVIRTELQLVGCASMLIASKYEEIYAPEVRDFVYITDKAYTKEHIIEMEAKILKSISFNVTVSTASAFLRRFLKAITGSMSEADTERFRCLARYFVELSLPHAQFLKYRPSVIAAAAIALANLCFNRPFWPRPYEKFTGKSEGDISSCVTELSKTAKEAPGLKLRAAFKKYQAPKFFEVAMQTVPSYP